MNSTKDIIDMVERQLKIAVKTFNKDGTESLDSIRDLLKVVFQVNIIGLRFYHDKYYNYKGIKCPKIALYVGFPRKTYEYIMYVNYQNELKCNRNGYHDNIRFIEILNDCNIDYTYSDWEDRVEKKLFEVL